MKHKKKIYIYFMFLILFLLIKGCKKDLTPADNTQPQLQLSVKEVGVTETWLQLTLQNPNSKSQITISRNDSTIKRFNNSTSDTLIYDSGLLPNHDYTYTATLTTDSRTLTAESQTTTMDTTSHDFTWQSWTFGAKGSSILYDVAIIDENNIWAVGEIYTEDTYTYDSLGNWIPPYNAVHWNGSEWKLERILYQGGYWVINTIYAFKENDISFEYAVRWNGIEFVEQSIPSILIGQSIKKMWGTSSDDMYVVGDNGLIAYYNGQTWQRIESGTQNNLHDIWGVYNEETGEKIVLVSAQNKILKINKDNVVEEFNWLYSDKLIRSIWFKNMYQVFGCGSNVYKKSFNNEWRVLSDVPSDNIYMTFIHGDNTNDFFVIGNHGLVLHNNGTTWRRFFNYNNNFFWSVYSIGNIMVAVGDIWYSSPHQAIILMMNRN